jgi:hypothetical protein
LAVTAFCVFLLWRFGFVLLLLTAMTLKYLVTAALIVGLVLTFVAIRQYRAGRPF